MHIRQRIDALLPKNDTYWDFRTGPAGLCYFLL